MLSSAAASIDTPPPDLSTATAVYSPALAQDPSRATAVSSPVPVPASTSVTAPVLAQTASPVLSLAPLFHARAKPRSNDRSKSISMVLLDLSNKGIPRQGEWKDASISNCNEMQLVRNVLELCEYVCTDDEMQLMRDGRRSSTDEALGLVATEIEKKLP